MFQELQIFGEDQLEFQRVISGRKLPKVDFLRFKNMTDSGMYYLSEGLKRIPSLQEISLKLDR